MIISNSISLILYTDNQVLYQTNCGIQIVPHFYLIFFLKKNMTTISEQRDITQIVL